MAPGASDRGNQTLAYFQADRRGKARQRGHTYSYGGGRPRTGRTLLSYTSSPNSNGLYNSCNNYYTNVIIITLPSLQRGTDVYSILWKVLGAWQGSLLCLTNGRGSRGEVKWLIQCHRVKKGQKWDSNLASGIQTQEAFSHLTPTKGSLMIPCSSDRNRKKVLVHGASILKRCWLHS